MEKEENLVKKTCRELGISQKELAQELGVTRQSINNWANNRTEPPKIFSRFAELLRIEKRFYEIQKSLNM